MLTTFFHHVVISFLKFSCAKLLDKLVQNRLVESLTDTVSLG